ncbi:hypothetical protein ASPCAL12943 [Aspergillus calidoustus]|uniref:Uncharacterized protein n=1 Tax=Aspergillus calidoustus TaxID=454130 RepID=A0A0U5GDC9_ASPCI|nr:hypothetical protein ASPCAL12943 [Aspergillus calidoustus]
MGAMVSSRTTCNTPILLFRISDARTRKVVGIEVVILVAFFMYTAILYRLSTIWDRQSLPSETKSTSNNSPKDEHADFTKEIAVDVWFGLTLMPTFDAIAIVGTCNLAIINRWHYFVSIRTMVLAYLASIIVILSSKPGTTNFIYEHPGSVFMLTLAVYAGMGACLDYFRAPPPRTSMNPRAWTMSEYVGAIGRSDGTWSEAIIVTAVTCGLAPALTISLPVECWGIIPLVSTAFEAIIFRKTRFRRTCQYTVLSAPFFQGGVCVHWGLKQIIGSPRLFSPPWMFLLLLVASRLILDLHLQTLFRNCPEFQWARARAVLPTTQLVPVVLILLFLEMMHLSVVKWVKPVSVLGIYLAGIVAGTLPGAYTLAFGREKK